MINNKNAGYDINTKKNNIKNVENQSHFFVKGVKLII